MVARKADQAEEVEQAEQAEEVAPHQGAGRPNDTEIVKPKYPNSTFASRAAKRAESLKRVAESRNKAVQSSEVK